MTIEAEGTPTGAVDDNVQPLDDVEAPAETPAEEAQDADGDVVVTIGDAPAPESDDDDELQMPELPDDARDWLKVTRKNARLAARRANAAERENANLKRKLQALETPKPTAPALGPKPTLRDDDVDFDEDKFEAKLLKWNEQKRKIDEAKETEAREWKKVNDEFTEAAAKLKAPDFEDARQAVIDAIDPVRQGILMKAARGQAHVMVLALGRQPDELKRLSGITDLVDFTVAVTELKGQIKVSSRKPPPPERTPSSAGRTAAAGDKTLEALEREYEKTGDRSKIIAYKQKQASGKKQ
jgi:hypothetical protein